jgi:hypothetical protein
MDSAMTLATYELDGAPYDFLGHAQELICNVDVNDKIFLIRYAIELQEFLVALYYPRFSQLDLSRKGPTPQVDMIAVARRHAAVKLYEHYTSPATERRGHDIRTRASLLSPSKRGLGLRLKRVQAPERLPCFGKRQSQHAFGRPIAERIH